MHLFHRRVALIGLERVRRDSRALLLARLAARRRALVEETGRLARLVPAAVLTAGAGPAAPAW